MSLHWIHANHLGQTPWGWRDGVVSAPLPGAELPPGWEPQEVVDVAYLEGGRVRVSNGRPLGARLPVGTPVRVHERYWALQVSRALFPVRLDGGLGDVPKPAQPHLWHAERQVAVTDNATGLAVLLTGRPADDPWDELMSDDWWDVAPEPEEVLPEPVDGESIVVLPTASRLYGDAYRVTCLQCRTGWTAEHRLDARRIERVHRAMHVDTGSPLLDEPT